MCQLQARLVKPQVFFKATFTQTVFIMEDCLWWTNFKIARLTEVSPQPALRNEAVLEAEFVEVKYITGGFIKTLFLK